MAQNMWTAQQQQPQLQPQPQPGYRGRRWLRSLVIGLILFILAAFVLLWTDNPNLFPTVILIGNFLVPVVFVAFLYDHQHISSLSLDTVAASFCIGGVLGVLGAAVIESFVIPAPSNPTQGLSLVGAFLVALIEEGCKIAAVILLARKIRHTSQMDGLLLVPRCSSAMVTSVPQSHQRCCGACSLRLVTGSGLVSWAPCCFARAGRVTFALAAW